MYLKDMSMLYTEVDVFLDIAADGVCRFKATYLTKFNNEYIVADLYPTTKEVLLQLPGITSETEVTVSLLTTSNDTLPLGIHQVRNLYSWVD